MGKHSSRLFIGLMVVLAAILALMVGTVIVSGIFEGLGITPNIFLTAGVVVGVVVISYGVGTLIEKFRE